MSYFTRELKATPRDRDMLFQLTSDPVVTRYLGFETHTSPEQAARLIHDYARSRGKWIGVFDGMPWAERLVGVAGAEWQGHSVAAAIYFKPITFHGRGAGRRFAAPWVRSIFEDGSKPKRVFADCHVDNVPVQRVLERMGATREGRLRSFKVYPNISPEPADTYVYSLLPGELRELTS